MKIDRKCSYCKKGINVLKDDCIVDVGTFHKNCWVSKYITDKEDKHEKTYLIQKANTLANKKALKTKEKLKKQYEDDVNKNETRNELFSYIYNMYGVTTLSNRFFSKISNIFNGKYNGVFRPIPPEHLLDMWKQKTNYLNRINNQNINHGKIINGEQRVHYDLAILLSKYDSYLKWLYKQQQISKAASVENTSINKETIGVLSNRQKVDEKDVVEDILDDFFND